MIKGLIIHLKQDGGLAKIMSKSCLFMQKKRVRQPEFQERKECKGV